MVLTSLNFLLFLGVTCLLYFLAPRRLRKPILLLANLYFYWSWQPGFLLLLLAGTGVSYGCALAAEAKDGARRRLWSTVGVICLLGVLVVFKYLDFFGTTLLHLLGRSGQFHTGLLLPLGVSFYTFSATGYLFDVMRKKIPAERNLLDFAVFHTFFPVILSGPICKARKILPQLRSLPGFELPRVKNGLLRMAVGTVKKLVLADTLGIFVNRLYQDPGAVSGGIWLLGVIAYSLQIYLDFSGYSDMAIGTAKILGVHVDENFLRPYLGTTIKDFWKRWHISLTDWFREYLYFPLGGSRKGKYRTWLNVLIVFTVSGLWHGAGFTFVIWGLLNGVYQVVGSVLAPLREKLFGAVRLKQGNPVRRVLSILCCFALTTVAWIFFRANTVGEAVFIIKRILLILRDGFGSLSLTPYLAGRQAALLLAGLLTVLVFELLQEHRVRLPRLEKTAFPCWLVLALLCIVIAVFGVYGASFDPQSFVYFQF